MLNLLWVIVNQKSHVLSGNIPGLEELNHLLNYRKQFHWLIMAIILG